MNWSKMKKNSTLLGGRIQIVAYVQSERNSYIRKLIGQCNGNVGLFVDVNIKQIWISDDHKTTVSIHKRLLLVHSSCFARTRRNKWVVGQNTQSRTVNQREYDEIGFVNGRIFTFTAQEKREFLSYGIDLSTASNTRGYRFCFEWNWPTRIAHRHLTTSDIERSTQFLKLFIRNPILSQIACEIKDSHKPIISCSTNYRRSSSQR